MLLLCSGPGIMELKLSPSSHVRVFDLKGKCFILGQMHPPPSPFLDREQSNPNPKTEGTPLRTVHGDPAPNWVPGNVIDVQPNPFSFVQMSFK